MPRHSLSDSVPRRTADLSLHEVDGHSLACPAGQTRLVCLNRSARAVLDQIDGHRSIREISSQLAAPLGLSAQHLVADVADAVLWLASSDLVALALPPEPERRAATADGGALTLRFAEHTLNLHSSFAGVMQEVRSRFALMLTEPAAAPDVELQVDVHHGAWVYFQRGADACEDAVVTRGGDGMHPRDFLKAQVVRSCMQLRRDLLWLHAGAAEVSGRCVLVAGSNGRGKSSLIAELCRSGARYLSDEVVPVDPIARAAVPFPVTPIRRESTPAPLPRHRLRELKRHYVPMTAAQVCPGAPRIAAIVFPEFVTAGRPRLEPCGAAESAVALVESSLDAMSNGTDGIDRVLSLCRRLPAARLTFHDVGHGAVRIHEWLDRLPRDAWSQPEIESRGERTAPSLIAS